MVIVEKKKQHHLGTVLDYDEPALRAALENCSGCPELEWRTANLDTSSSHEESIELELKRLLALQSYRILDTDKKPSLERLTALAARIFDVPICLVSLVDLGRQWFSSNRGLGDTRETPRNAAFCAHAILSEKDIFIVPNALEDPRFSSNGLVTGDPLIRFYAGAPLVTSDGYKLGTLCIIDIKPRPKGLNLDDKQNLREIAALAMAQIEETKIGAEKSERKQARMIACTAHDLITPLTSIQLNIGLLCEDEGFISNMTKSQRESIGNTKECVDMMSNICQQSIEYLRGQFTSSRINLEDKEGQTIVNIPHMVKSLEHVMRTYPKKVPFRIRVDDDVPLAIKSQLLSIFRSSLNFLTNACNVTKSGSIDFHLYMKYASSTKSSDVRDFLVFECTDTGPGVDDEKSLDLFNAPGGLKLSKESENRALGLGLHSVSILISGIGGDYGYKRRTSSQSAHLSGNVFWFAVPVVLPESSPVKTTDYERKVKRGKYGEQNFESTVNSPTDLIERSMSSSPLGLTNTKTTLFTKKSHQTSLKPANQTTNLKNQDARAPAKRKLPCIDTDKRPLIPARKDCSSSSPHRIKYALIIDDSKTIRKVLERALQSVGFQVRQVENGMQGLEEMKATMYDIVFCDFMMPIMDGIDCVHQYRQWEATHRAWFKQYIVGISAHADGADSNRGLKVGMSKFVPKPFSLKSLQALVQTDDIKNISEKLNKLTDDSKVQSYMEFTKPEPKKSLSPKKHGSQAPTCLVAEDSRSISKAMIRCIEKKGWNTCLAKDGDEALRLLKSRNWDAVFMDDQLPLMTGSCCVAIFRKWEEQFRTSPQRNLLLCSANYSQTCTEYPPGFNGVLPKPFRPSTISSILDKCSP